MASALTKEKTVRRDHIYGVHCTSEAMCSPYDVPDAPIITRVSLRQA